MNVICELARKNPKNYLPLAPTLFKILQSSTNNWMLIKIIKLVAAQLILFFELLRFTSNEPPDFFTNSLERLLRWRRGWPSAWCSR